MTLSSVEKVLAITPNNEHCFIFCSDPGAYYCLSPIYETLVQRGQNIAWIMEGWCRENSECHQKSFDWKGFVEFINQNNIIHANVIIGQQKQASETRRVIQFCNIRGYFSLLLLDHWWVEPQLFYDPVTGIAHLPNKVCTMDRHSKGRVRKCLSELCNVNDYDDNIHVVGHPGIQRGAELVRRVSREEIDQYKGSIGAVNKKIYLFLLEPYTDDYRLERIDQSMFGFTEFTALDYFFRNFPIDNCTVIIKPHPRQSLPKVRHCLNEHLQFRDYILENNKGLEFLIAVSDEVIGITTIGLLIAFHAGKPIRSLQIGRNEKGAALSNEILEKHLIV